MFSSIVITIKVCFLLWIANFAFCKLVNPADAAWFKSKPLWLMMLFYAAGMFSPNIWGVYVVMILTLPLMAKTRAEAAALFIIALGSAPDLSYYLRIGSTSIMALDKFFCLAVGFLWVMLRKPPRGLRFSGRYDIPFLLIFGLELIQARGMNFTSTIRSLLSTILGMGLPYFVLTRSINRVEDFRRVMISLVYIGFVLAVIGFYESRAHLFVYQQVSNHLGMGALSFLSFKFRAGMLRAMTSFGDSTAFSLFLAITLIAAIACRESFRSTSKFVYALLTISLGIFVASSRNAYIAVVLGIIFFDLYRKRYVAVTGKVALLGMGYAVLLLLAEVSPYFRTMTGQTADTASTSDYRTQLLTRGMEEFHKHPYAGIDGATLLQNMHDLTQGEGIVDFVNGYLFYALTAGISGFIALVLAFLLPCWAMLKSQRAMRMQGPALQRGSAFVFAIAATYLITTAFTGFGNRGSTYFYMVLGLGAVLYAWRKVQPELLAASDRPSGPRPPVFAPLAPPMGEVPEPALAPRRGSKRGRRRSGSVRGR